MKKNTTIIDLTLENRRIGINYDAKDEKTIEFFKVVQNKLLRAISRQTAAELV